MFKNITYRVKINTSYETALVALIEFLVEEGFRVLTNLKFRKAMSLILEPRYQRYSILSIGDPVIPLQSTDFGQVDLPVNITIEESIQGSVISIEKLETELVRDFVASSGDLMDLPMATLNRLEHVADRLKLSSDLEYIGVETIPKYSQDQ